MKVTQLARCFVVCLALRAVAARAADDDNIVYARNIAVDRRLVVRKTEVPRPEPPRDVDGKPVVEPGVQYPEHEYEYGFAVESLDGANRQVVATTGMGTLHGEVERMKFQIFDAFVDGDQLVVLYCVGGQTYGDTAMVGGPKSGFLMRPKLAPPLATDTRDSAKWVIGGRLEGSPKDGNLRAIVTMVWEGQTVDRRFLLVNENGAYKWLDETAKKKK